MATMHHESELSYTLPTSDNLIPPTDFGAFVTQALAQRHRPSLSSASAKIDQDILRQCINLASSFLLIDVTSNPDRGLSTWYEGLSWLVDLVIVLHKRNELEVETVSAASRACSECWSIASNWRGLDESRQRVREIGGKLKRILDPNDRTYKGQRVYAP